MKKFIPLIYGFLSLLLIVSPTMADDTEIFVNNSTVASDRTNVLFAIDTSGSMASHVIEAVTPDYDPTRNYIDLNNGVGIPVPITYVKNDGSTEIFDCERNSYYLTAWTRNAMLPYQHLVGLAGDMDNEIRTFIPNNRMYLTCNGNFANGKGFMDKVEKLTGTQVTCPVAKTALDAKGYFYDKDAACDSYTIPVDTTGAGNSEVQADYANQMFVSGNFLAYAYRCVELQDTTACDTSQFGKFITNRIALTKDVVHDILENDAGYEIKVGIMRFNANLTNSIQNIEGYKTAGTPISTISSFGAGGGTPLQNTYYEMYKLFDGDGYTTPITNSCQKNLIVYMTDGTPSNGDHTHGSDIESLTSNMRLANQTAENMAAGYDPSLSTTDPNYVAPATLENCYTGSNSASAGECIPVLAEYMYTQDMNTSLTNYPDSNGVNRIQNVETHTIGFFDTDGGAFAKPSRILSEAARRGGGTYNQVSDTGSLRNAFAGALESILDKATTFTAPSVSVNNFNRLTNFNELYFSLFQPQSSPNWIGNVKKYQLVGDEIVDSRNPPVAAVNPATGEFKDSAISYWTPSGTVDGKDVAKGGFASRLLASRNIFSNLTSNTDLNNNANQVNESNISLNQLGVTTDNERTNLINWMYGLTTNALGTVTSTNMIGDTLHTTPVLINYYTGNSTIDQTMYFGTNTGFIHAIDPSTAAGSQMEEFAFFPDDLLNKVKGFERNQSTGTFAKAYGLDGPISSWIEGDQGNRVVEQSGQNGVTRNEKAHLYFTMRRGGKNIYALDVTSRSSPKFEWKIKGGTGGTLGFEELGETWSKLVPARIPYETGVRDVLIFGGGYDPAQDTQDASTVRTSDTQGRAIYIIDATDGELLWRGVPEGTTAIDGIPQSEFSDLNYSIPSDISVIDVNTDVNNNRIADRLYVGDMGGQVWRFDILPTISGAGGKSTINIAGGVIADLGGSTAATNRKFYNSPSVSRVTDDAFGSYLAIAIGSGKRASPRSTEINDKFYMIKDPYVFAPKYLTNGTPTYNYGISNSLPTTIKDSYLSDITNIPNPSYDQIATFGWKLTLDPAEKILTQALTADGNVLFTSYIPVNISGAPASCDPSAFLGSGRIYAVSVLNARAAFNKNPLNPNDLTSTTGTTDLTGNGLPTDRFVDVNSPGIPPSPQIIISEGDRNPNDDCNSATKATLLVGTESFIPPICTAPVRTYWHRYDTDIADL